MTDYRCPECGTALHLHSEIARLRADVERKDQALREAKDWLEYLASNYLNNPVSKITAALADTADKQGEQP